MTTGKTSTTRKSTSRKPRSTAAARKPAKPTAKGPSAAAKPRSAPAAAKSAAPTAPPARAPAVPTAPVVVSESKPVMANPEMKKQELVEKVVRRSGLKKRDVKPVVEAMLAVMGDALADGREFNIEPLGKLMINRVKHTAKHRISVLKLRQKTARPADEKDDQDPLAPAAE